MAVKKPAVARLVVGVLTTLAVTASCRTPLSKDEAASHPLAQTRRTSGGVIRGDTMWLNRADRNRMPEPREIATSILRSTYVVVVLDCDSNMIALGSAFALTEDLLMTNAHVLEGHYAIRVHPVGDRSRRFVVTEFASDRRRDLALLNVPGLNAHPVEVAFESPRVGDQIYVAGNPDGLEGSFTDGLVSAYRSFDGCPPVFQMTAPIAPGSSGGAVVNRRGGVVGVAVGARGRGENLNFAVRLEELVAFAAEHGLAHSAAPAR